MKNPRFSNTPRLCPVCGSRTSRSHVVYCEKPECRRIGQANMPQATLQKLRKLCGDNVALTGRPNYKAVARALKTTPDKVRYYWSQNLARQQKQRQLKCQADVQHIKAQLIADIRSWAAEPKPPPYKGADMLTGELITGKHP